MQHLYCITILLWLIGLIGELTAAKAQNEAHIQKITDELSDVSRKLKTLQDEKKLLLSKSSSEAQQKSLEVQALEQVHKILFQTDKLIIISHIMPYHVSEEPLRLLQPKKRENPKILSG